MRPPTARAVSSWLASMTLIVAGEYPTWGVTVQTLSVALIALHQLVGPVLFRAALARAGEIGKMDAPA